ncbi:MAG: hypothetical protein WCS94_00245 [Verrucomicrobiota bacterium]
MQLDLALQVVPLLIVASFCLADFTPQLHGSGLYIVSKGLQPSAQGCGERATLGHRSIKSSTATRLHHPSFAPMVDLAPSPGNLETLKISFFGAVWCGLVRFSAL